MTTGFSALFQRYADTPCLHDGDVKLTYRETLALGRSLIQGLPRDHAFVVLRCSVSAASVSAYIALIIDGHVPLLIETDLSEPLSQQLYDNYQPDAVIDPVAGTVDILGTPPVTLHPDLGLLLTTSGSTGSPKLVRLSTAGLRANADAIATYLALDPQERPLLHLPMSYSYGLSIINSHLVAGSCIYLTRKSVMEAGYWNDLRAYEATSIAGVPFHYSAVRRLGEAKLEIPSMRTLTQAGGRLDPRLAAFFADWTSRTGRKFYIMYGQTEAGPRVAFLPPEYTLTAHDAIGVPIPGVTIELVDEDGRAVTDGQPGEMLVHSPGVMMGYAMHANDLARGDELGGILRTGDIARRGEDGLLRIVGRRSRILKIYGLRVNVDEIEQRLLSFGLTAFCFGDEDKLRILIENVADVADIRQKIVDLFSLPPRGFEIRSGIKVERSASGKVLAAALADAWAAAG